MACSGALSSPFGAGMRFTTASRILSTPKPVFPDAGMMSSGSQPIKSMIWSDTSSGMAPGRSILFRIGMISRSCSRAR